MATDPPGPPHILLVEDNADARVSMQQILELYGYRVSTAADGEEGLRQLTDSRPDLAIVDIGLPTLSGYDLARRARAAGIQVPLVALTAYAMKTDKGFALDAGFDVHLAKPADISHLLEIMRKLLTDRA